LSSHATLDVHPIMLIIVGISLLGATTTSATDSTEPMMAIAGGGFRAQSVGTGFMTGLLSYIGKSQGEVSPTFESTKLLDRFGTFSTNSGGSWFFGSLAYSSSFKSLLEAMAASPELSAFLYNEGYTRKWLKATNVTAKEFDSQAKHAKAIAKNTPARLGLSQGDEDTIVPTPLIEHARNGARKRASRL